MFDIMKIDDPNLCNSLLGKNMNISREMSSPIIFVDSSTDYCEEMVYGSDCVMIHADIVNNIEDGLLGINFMKPDDTDHVQYFTEPNKIKFEDENSNDSVHIENGTQNEVIVEEVAEQEIISNSVDWSSVDEETWTANKFKELQLTNDTILDDYSCSLCGHCFPERSLLLDHLFLNHSKTAAYRCHRCNDTFRRKKALINHIRSHDKLTQPMTAAAIVKENSKFRGNKEKRSSFEEKISAKRPEKGHLYDDRCLKDSPQMQLSKKQYKRSNFQCSYCKLVISNATRFMEHMRQEHTLYLDGFVCKYCGKRCKNFRGLQKHSTMHSNGELLSCNTCNKQFCTRTRLKRHMLSHRDKAVICDDCGEKMVDHRAMLRHRSSHHTSASRNGVLTTRTFPCYNCDKIFGSKSSQQIHMRMHTGERPYSCRYCVKAFADGGTLRKHERIHTGEKPYVCPICRKAFNQRVVLREHIRVHHAGFNTITEKHFKCEVCHAMCNSSQELCSHLVKHSDENTAKQRSPFKKPRKYKKWKKHEEEPTDEACADNAFINEKSKTSEISNEEDSTSYYVLTDEEGQSDNNPENELAPCVLEQSSNYPNTEFQGIKIYFEENDNNYSSFADEVDEQKWKLENNENNNYSPFADQVDKRKWKMESNENAEDVNVNYPLSSFGDKLPEESITTADSCGVGNNVESCLNLISVLDNKNSDCYFNANDYTCCESKNELWYTLKEKCEFPFSSDFSAHSGLGLGATVELQSEL